MATVAVLLAAGAGSRFEGPTHKLLAPFRGRRVIDWAVASATESGLPVLVVTGDVDLELGPTVLVVANPRWAEGIATSLQAAIAAAGDAEAVVVGLADQPLIPAEAWRLVAAADAPIAVATYDGKRRNPVRLGREIWPLLPVTGDQGASVLFEDHPVVEVACPGDPKDIDSTKDLSSWS